MLDSRNTSLSFNLSTRCYEVEHLYENRMCTWIHWSWQASTPGLLTLTILLDASLEVLNSWPRWISSMWSFTAWLYWNIEAMKRDACLKCKLFRVMSFAKVHVGQYHSRDLTIPYTKSLTHVNAMVQVLVRTMSFGRVCSELSLAH